MSDVAQLAAFVHGVDSDFNVTEEMLELQAMKGTTACEDIFQEVKVLMSKFNLPIDKLHSDCINNTEIRFMGVEDLKSVAEFLVK